jgi:hypothetical protein
MRQFRGQPLWSLPSQATLSRITVFLMILFPIPSTNILVEGFKILNLFPQYLCISGMNGNPSGRRYFHPAYLVYRFFRGLR